jgi:branched-chain amino acid transport system permease protein
MRFAFKTTYGQDLGLFRDPVQRNWYVALLAGAGVLPLFVPAYLSDISLVFIYGLCGLSLMVLAGYTGLVSLGHAAFLGIGAYVAAMLGKTGLPFLATLPLAMLLAGAIGVLVGLTSLRVRADFLAITTMGVGFLFVGIVRQQEWLGGELGISGIADPGMSKTAFMALTLALCVAVAALCLYIRAAWMGRVFNGIAEDEDTMRVLGIDASRYKLVAFAMGTALAGLAGALYAYHLKFIDPGSFGFVESITVLSMVVVGGIGSVPGAVIAAALLSALPAWFQFIGDYKLLVYGGLLFLMMRFSPGGMAALAKRFFNPANGSEKKGRS